MTVDEILRVLEDCGSPENVAGMARFGIVAKKAFGVPSPALKALAKDLKKQTTDRHRLAAELWETGVHDARSLAYLVDDPKLVTEEQMDRWVCDFDNWAICDSTCGHLFSRSDLAYRQVDKWIRRDEDFVKRAGIALIAWLTVHDKRADDEQFAKYLPMLEGISIDQRKLIRKAVSWALRQIGKRSLYLNGLAIETAERIGATDSPAARWIAADALRELRSAIVQKRLLPRRSE